MRRRVCIAAFAALLFHAAGVPHVGGQKMRGCGQSSVPPFVTSSGLTDNSAVRGLPSDAQTYEVGDLVDDFTLPSTTSDSISLHDYLGQVILIHVWHYA